MIRRKIALILVATGMVFALSSCQALLDMLFGEEGVTIEAQITAFQANLNNPDRTAAMLQGNLHPSMLNYTQLADEAVWDASPLSLANANFTFGAPDIDTNDIATCTYVDGNSAVGTIVFTMSLDGVDYKILKIDLTMDGETAPSFQLERFLGN